MSPERRMALALFQKRLAKDAAGMACENAFGNKWQVDNALEIEPWSIFSFVEGAVKTILEKYERERKFRVTNLHPSGYDVENP